MIDIEYKNAYSEVLEILKYIPIEDYNKIPKEKIQIFNKYADNSYKFDYNPSKTLQENNTSKIAKGIIAILYRDYWATDEHREKIITLQKYERQRIEKEKSEKYNLDNIFNKRNTIDNKQNYNIIKNNLPIEIKKDTIFTKIIGFFKKIKNYVNFKN